MNNLSTKDLNRLRSQAKIIMNRVEIFIETYLLEAPPDEKLINETLQEIIKATNSLTTAASKMKTSEPVHNDSKGSK
ncbi:hypothetical protein [Nostoc sp.]|uniref:hypothetical protein n=1 Tax=Nostoc sp. TaxID=1180 RepID=UPI002FF58E58